MKAGNKRQVFFATIALVLSVVLLGGIVLMAVAPGCSSHSGNVGARAPGYGGPAAQDSSSPWTGSGAGTAGTSGGGYVPSTRPPGSGPSNQTTGGTQQAQADITALVPPQSLPSPQEELWIIQKADAAAQPVATPPGAADEAYPGTGALATRAPDTGQMVPIPLKHTEVKASVSGYIAAVNVTQQFQNPYNGKIEAVYVFPLPHNAAINEFVMTVGDRHIRGIIRERQEAERVYQEARSQGFVASLLTQERPNIFTQSVANIEPGKRIDINITYFNTLAYVDGWYEFVFPMVVGPRFNPPGSSDGVGAVGRGGRGTSGQQTEVQYLRPEERSGHDIALAVQIDAGVPLEQIESRNHRVNVQRPRPAVAEVKLDPADSIPNKDFVLRYKVAGADIKSTLIARRDGGVGNHGGEGNQAESAKDPGGYFTLMLVPPADLDGLPRKPLEFVFTLDVSGSMEGAPIEQSKAAMRYALGKMRPDDTFQIVRFAGHAEVMAPQPVPATPENVRAALQYIDTTSAGGGTMMLEGIRAALNFPHDEGRLRVAAFLTDGYIGNETDILREIRTALGPARVFSFGVGSSPNRYLLDHMAKMGRGAAAYLGLNDNAEEVMAAYFDRVSHPAMTDLSIDWGGMQVEEVFPQELPDLYVGRPVILTGRFQGSSEGQTVVKVRGNVAGRTQEIAIPVNLDADAPNTPNTPNALPAVWARMKIADLADRAAYEPNSELPHQVRQVALEHGLMSAYTAFVAVDSLTRTQGEYGTSVAVPVPVPDGVRYDTTVKE